MHHQLGRLVICTTFACALSAAPLSLTGTVAAASSVASVRTGPPLTVTCSLLAGGQASQKISDCTGSGATAPEAGRSPAHGTFVVSTTSIDWSNAKRSVLSVTNVDHTGKADTCPARTGVTKDYQTLVKGQVATPGTTTRGMVGGPVKATLCVYVLIAAPHTVIVLNQGKITV